MTRQNGMLFDLLEKMAIMYFDGHYTVLRCTTNWRVLFATPIEYDDIAAGYVGATFADAAVAALQAQYLKFGDENLNRKLENILKMRVL